MADITYKINNKGSDYHLASSAYYTCATAASTVAKVANLQGSSSNTFNGGTIPLGITIYVKFTYSNTATNPTLNVNNSGAKSIVRYGSTVAGTSVTLSWRPGAIVCFTYDGNYWVMNSGIDDNTNGDTKDTAGARQQEGTLHIVGAPIQAAHTKTYSSTNITMHNGGITCPMLNIHDGLYFEGSGANITATEGELHLFSEDVMNINGNLAVTSSVNINGEEAATKEWVKNWIDEHYGESEIVLTVGMERDVFNGGVLEPVWYFQESVTGDKSKIVSVVPYAYNSRQGNYIFIDCSTGEAPNITYNGDFAVQQVGTSPKYYKLVLAYEQGTLSSKIATVAIEIPGKITYTLHILFDGDFYVD